jgi:mono/diheme cytochrome c family protein
MLLAIAVSILGFHLLQVSDPYVRNVLSLTGDPVRGHDIFEINCAGCHGLQADGRVGPSLQHVSKRKSKISLIHQVTSGQTPPMPKFQPSSQEMADLLSYLEKL